MLIYRWNSSRLIRSRAFKKLKNKGQGLIIFGLIFAAIGVFFGMQFEANLLTSFFWIGSTQLICFGFYERWCLSDLNNPPIDWQKIDYHNLNLNEITSGELLNIVNNNQTPKDLFLSIKNHWQVNFFWMRYMIHPDKLENYLSNNPVDSEIIWQNAVNLSAKFKLNRVEPIALLISLLSSSKPIMDWLLGLQLDLDDLISGVEWVSNILNRIQLSKRKYSFGGVARDWTAGYTPVLDRYSSNISKAVEYGMGQIHTSKSREEIIKTMGNLLTRPGRQTIALIGEVGVGKTSIVAAFAREILQGTQNRASLLSKDEIHGLGFKQIVSLNPGLILSATGGKGIESLIYSLFADIMHGHNIILFLDDAQLFFGTGTGAVDLSQLLLPILQQSRLQVIASFTPEDWQKIASTRPTVEQLFSRVNVGEPEKKDVIAILQDLSSLYEYQYGTINTYEALREVLRLSEHYLHDKAWPAKAIELLEDSQGNFEQRGSLKLVLPTSVQKVIESQIGAKVSSADQMEKNKLLNLETEIHKRMINQVRAVQVVSNALRRARAGVRNTNRPVGSFLFLGPTGVGKTELAKSLAEVYFGDENAMIRLDMSEYQLPEDVKRIIQTSAENQAGVSFLARVRERPFTVILFDEIEKAHKDIFDLMLQLLDEGRLTDTAGKEVSFKEAIVIVTSNAGSDMIRQYISKGYQIEQFEKQVVNALIDSHQFRPELLNRFDDIVVFRSLTPEELKQVALLMLKGINKSLEIKKITVSLTAPALDYLVNVGFDPRLGARPMRRAMQKNVEDVLARRMLADQIKPGMDVVLDVKDFDINL